MNENMNDFCIAPGAVASGLMIEKSGKPFLTEAGLFAMAGSLAYAQAGDGDSRAHCVSGVLRALAMARSGGLPEQVELTVLRAFAEGINPADGSEGGMALADVCVWVAQLVGTGRMGDVIEGNKSH